MVYRQEQLDSNMSASAVGKTATLPQITQKTTCAHVCLISCHVSCCLGGIVGNRQTSHTDFLMRTAQNAIECELQCTDRAREGKSLQPCKGPASGRSTVCALQGRSQTCTTTRILVFPLSTFPCFSLFISFTFLIFVFFFSSLCIKVGLV